MKNKLWGGRFAKDPNPSFMKFQASLAVDFRLYPYDIAGSIAYALELKRARVLTAVECRRIVAGLKQIKRELDRGLHRRREAEDIHSLVEVILTEKIGAAAKKLHTGRSRNDQVMLDMKLYLGAETGEIIAALTRLLETLTRQSDRFIGQPFPAYTHLQPAQPILFSHYLMAIAAGILRDVRRFCCLYLNLGECPLGAGAISGNAFPIDRDRLARMLKFAGPTRNSIDTVSQRDDAADLLYAIALLGVHLSRVAEDLIIFSSREFSLVELPEEFTTGSSLMPQKRNPDLLELIRGKSGRFIANLNRMLIVLKGLPTGYQKDLQEDKETVFDSIDQIKAIIGLFTDLVAGVKVNKERADRGVRQGQLTATDLADYFVATGQPFRAAHQRSGELVRKLEDRGLDLSQVNPGLLKSIDPAGPGAGPAITNAVTGYIGVNESINRRACVGGTAKAAVKQEIIRLRRIIKKEFQPMFKD